ncbi:arylesterase [Marinobacter caseinilyticus]|uniref:arylesterase n=1 Tax=Marinobacter caseinilyticus TaxID=2692195 RepID=UPI001409E2C9|nr:arylesterase [Marinobacter caseinilyticus]
MIIHTALLQLRSILFLLCIIFTSQAFASSGTVMIVGDSLSAAYGVATEQGWVQLLRNRLRSEGLANWTVINASISGETTDGGLRRLPELLARYTPDIVVIELGGNDGLRGFQPGVIENNLNAMIDQSQEAGAKVLLLGMQLPPNYGPRYTEAFAAIYPTLAKANATALVPFFLDGLFNGETMIQSDGIHPNQDAQPILLDNVWPTLKTMIHAE